MSPQEKINIDIFKVVTKSIAESESLDIMVETLAELLVGTLGIKGCSVFALNTETKELEVLTSFGLSHQYMTKGPLLSDSSIAATMRCEPTVIADTGKTDQLQYPDKVRQEGIKSIVSVPIVFSKEMIGALRLYHHDVWHVSERDLESLLLLGETIGLALMYARLQNTVDTIREALHITGVL